MPGRCADCSAVCSQRADDGNFYCDGCWTRWMDSSHRDKLVWETRRREEKIVREKTERDAVLLERDKKQKAEQEAKTRQYWEARSAATEKLTEVVTPRAASNTKAQAMFWGICDIKYDPRADPADRVKVLELGDGRVSRFSHHGAVIKERFDEVYCMDSNPLRRGVLVDNKKFTHDAFVTLGLEHLRPQQRSYPRRYEACLAARIASDLGAAADGMVVLKLVNRARGAGVVVCPVANLDATLQRLLLPPVGRELQEWLAKRWPGAMEEDLSDDVLAEQQLHYWSNECSIFVAEEVCHSMPVSMPEASEGEVFDGTMRVSFVLLRDPKDENKLEIEWLGGYWKLPPGSTEAEDGDSPRSSLDQAHKKLVSSFNTEEKRTAPVSKAHLLEVYAALVPAILPVFESPSAGIRELHFSYPNDPVFRAFAMARCASGMRPNLVKSTHVLEQAKKLLQIKAPCYNDYRDLPERSVLSYIERSLGVNCAMRFEWSKAGKHFQEAEARMPTNATALYFRGVVLQEEQKHAEAVEWYLKALALDPDFRTPLMALGECWTLLGEYSKAVEASVLCLHRQPDAPVAQFNMGQAIYRQLHGGGFQGSRDEVARLRERGRQALQIARAGRPDVWGAPEDEILRYFLEDVDRCDGLPLQPHRKWRTYGWRP